VNIVTHKPDDPEAEPHIVAALDAPEILRRDGLMTGVPRGADVVARTDVECLRLGKPALEQVLAARPEIAAELAEILASRRMGLVEAKDKLDDAARKSRHAREREKILGSIKTSSASNPCVDPPA